MNIKALLNKNKYVLSVFGLLAMLSLIYDGFENIGIFACRILLCAGIALFFSSYLCGDVPKEKSILAAFTFLSIISCYTIFLTGDLHILLSLLCFLIALFFSEKVKVLTPVFAALCVAVQPLSILFFVPSIIFIQLIKKQNFFAGMSAVASIAVFVITKFLENTEFYAYQFSSYYLSIHLVHFSKTHIEVLTQFLIASAPLIVVALIYLVRLFMNGKKFASIAIPVLSVLSVYAFSLSKNYHTVYMILIPIFASFISLDNCKEFKKTNDEIASFFTKHFLLFFLLVAFAAGYPLIFGQTPIDSEFFKRATFIIFREE